MNSYCPVCHSSDHHEFLFLPDMPVSIGVQWPTQSEARSCARGDLRLAFCHSCGFIWNVDFDETKLEYSQRYDNSLDFSTVFWDNAGSLANRLIETYDVREKSVVELGCGKGHFLSLLCELGQNNGIGFDPSYQGERVANAASTRIEFVQDFYGEKYTDHAGDLICCRHVLEHIANPVAFLDSVRKTIGARKDSIVYFEVPNVRLILDRLSVWDIIYEHCNYFSLESLTRLFQQEGFETLRVAESYQNQFIGLEARLSGSRRHDGCDLSSLSQLVASFYDKLLKRTEMWSRRLEAYRFDRKRVVIWGAGAKTVGFVNMLRIEDQIPFVVDINPHKQGLYLAGCGQQIVAPESLRSIDVDVVILMNPIYRSEVEQNLAEMEVQAELVEA